MTWQIPPRKRYRKEKAPIRRPVRAKHYHQRKHRQKHPNPESNVVACNQPSDTLHQTDNDVYFSSVPSLTFQSNGPGRSFIQRLIMIVNSKQHIRLRSLFSPSLTYVQLDTLYKHQPSRIYETHFIGTVSLSLTHLLSAEEATSEILLFLPTRHSTRLQDLASSMPRGATCQTYSIHLSETTRLNTLR